VASAFFVHHDADNVGVAVVDIERGQSVEGWLMQSNGSVELVANGDIPLGHKIALAPIGEGQAVVKYGHPIGKATRAIAKGEHVHTHNLKSARW
jgi:(2R)-sulfolactate sulfo-lyase subunit alpha